MAKSKLKEEGEDREEAEKTGGLELVSIGSLYSGGAWDKKYWSSTRGKDRYPYPVGYQARRAYNGGAYKMEIHEGPKGPLFAITSTDGYSCSGQTPDIVWQKFQKNCCPHTKIWHGKRFSCMIDGIEFFGFKNPFVQRLLRELVTNINGIAEQSPLSPSFSNGYSGTELNNRCTDACTHPNLPPYLARSQVKGKRSKSQKITNPESLSTASFKRSRAEDVMYIAEPSDSASKTHKQWRSTLSFNQEQESCKLPGTLSTAVCLKPVAGGETDHSSAKDDFPLKSVDCSDHLTEKAAPGPEESMLAWSKSSKSTTGVVNLSVEDKILDRSLDTKVDGSNFTMSVEGQAEDATAPKDQPCVHNVDLCAPDTLDFEQDNITNSAQATHDISACSVREELVVTEAITSQGLITESHPEEVIGTPNSNGNSERSDFDSAGQDIAKSMMTVLLPQAIPLLKNKSRKKKTIGYSEILPNAPKPHENNDENLQFVEVQSPGAYGSVLPGSEHAKSVVPDSFDGGQCGVHVTNQPISPSNTAEADQPCFDTDACPPCRVDQFVNIDGTDSSVCQFDTDGIKDIFCHNQVQSKVQLALDKRHQDDYLYPYESVSGIKSANENVLYEENQDTCKKMDENSIGTKFLSGEKDLNRGTDFNDVVAKSNMSQRGLGASVQILRNDISVKAETLESGNLSTAQVTKNVYTRKKVSKAASSTRKCNASFSESITCRNLRDDSIPETTRTLLNSEMSQMSSSVDKPHKNAIFGSELMVGDQLNGMQIDETTSNPSPLSESKLPFVLQTQTFSCASTGKDASNLFAATVSKIEKPHAYSEGRLVGSQNTSDTNGPPVLSAELGTTFSCYNTSSVKEVQNNSDLKLHRILKHNNELEGIFELVGCYLHPMPVLSLLVVTRGDEINVCALCGHLVDKNRTLFLYKLAIEETRTGNPSFVGHTSVTFPFSTDIFGRETALERSGLQLTPDGQNLVLLGSMKTPYCREGRTDCLCSTCSLNCSEQSTVKIVQVKTGYVSVLVKLSAVDSMQCILACEPNHLIAAGESGRLHLWTMNSAWSAPTEEFIISANDCISPCIVELKRVPNCASLVVGNNGFGEFTVWDVSRRMFMARVSSPSASACQFFPISSFTWQRVVHSFHYSTMEEQINGIVDATKLWFSENSECNSLPPLDGEDVAIWLLVSTIPELDTQEDYISSDCGINPVGWWRLALLVKNMLILGKALDPRAAAIGSSSGNGIIGTFDGLVYMWEFTTGTRLGTLHHFEGESVSCIATDNSKPGVISVAGDKGQLLVYRRSCK